MSDARALRDRLEVLHAELAEARRAPEVTPSSGEVQSLAAELGTLRSKVADLQKALGPDEQRLWDELLKLRRVQARELAEVSQYGRRGGRGSPAALLGLYGFLGAAGLGIGLGQQSLPGAFHASVAVLCALAAPTFGWLAWHRVRLARALEEAQRLF